MLASMPSCLSFCHSVTESVAVSVFVSRRRVVIRGCLARAELVLGGDLSFSRVDDERLHFTASPYHQPW